MSQATTWGSKVTGPATQAQIGAQDNESFNALLSLHSGASRPAYAVAGTHWIKVISGTSWEEYLYDGTHDILLRSVNPTTGISVTEDGAKTDLSNVSAGSVTRSLMAADTGNKGKVIGYDASTGDPAAMSLENLAGVLPTTKGGTGLTSYVAGDLLYASDTNVLSKLGKGTALQSLRMNSAGTAPEWGNASTSPVKAWVNFDGTNTPTIRGSYNVSSITDNGSGQYTVNFTNAMSDANYAAVGMVGGYSNTGTDWRAYVLTTNNFTTGGVGVLSAAAGTPGDVPAICVAILR